MKREFKSLQSSAFFLGSYTDTKHELLIVMLRSEKNSLFFNEKLIQEVLSNEFLNFI